MIREIATLTIDPSRAEAFLSAAAQAKPLFLAAPDCHGMALERVIEDPSRYLLVVDWATLEAHTVAFRGSGAFQQYRALVGPFFTASPVVIHTQVVA